MSYYGDPLGLNWMPMLALYSSLGNKSNTHEQKCQIGTQLQKLDGKDRIVIEGISKKIDQLIQRNNVSVGPNEMEKLKDSIVKELGRIASQSGNRSTGPVVCDANSVIFDEDVKKILSDLVREKAEGVTQKSYTTVNNDNESFKSISEIIRMSIIAPDHFKGNLYSKDLNDILDMLEKGNNNLLINTREFVDDGRDNSVYVMENPLLTWTRRLTDVHVVESALKRYEGGIPSVTLDMIKDVTNSTETMDDGIFYVYNDVELLRVVSSIIHNDPESKELC
ncbi:unnamed protein product [Pylaiella littoralis]